MRRIVSITPQDARTASFLLIDAPHLMLCASAEHTQEAYIVGTHVKQGLKKACDNTGCLRVHVRWIIGLSVTQIEGNC